MCGSSDMDWFIIAEDPSRLTHKEGSDETYQALKKQYPGAQLKRKEMKQHNAEFPSDPPSIVYLIRGRGLKISGKGNN